MANYDPADFALAGCSFVKEAPSQFIGVFHITRGDICRECSWYDRGNCPAFVQLFRSRKPRSKAPGDQAATVPSGPTVREQAAALGISISELRRRRRQGVA